MWVKMAKKSEKLAVRFKPCPLRRVKILQCFKNTEMKDNQDILTRIGRNDGMTVPDGFFEQFVSKMAYSLPVNPEAEQPRRPAPRKSLWGTIRPYVYMAAMFAGIWCMLKMFTIMSPAGVDLSIDNNRALSDALSDDNFIYEYINDDISARDIYDEIYDDSLDVADFSEIDSLMPAE